MPTTVHAPFAGRVLALRDVPDPVFAGGVVGPGLAIVPLEEEDVAVLAPCDGRIVKIHPHAVVIACETDAVIVHLGIDTVELGGEGFSVLAHDGESPGTGAHVLTWSPRVVTASGRSAMCPVVAMQAPEGAIEPHVSPGDRVAAGARLFTWR